MHRSSAVLRCSFRGEDAKEVKAGLFKTKSALVVDGSLSHIYRQRNDRCPSEDRAVTEPAEF